MRREGLQEVVMEGRVSILLRIHNPDQDIHQPDHPLDSLAVGALGRVKVRQVQEDEAGLFVREVRNFEEGVALLHVQPVQQGPAAIGSPDTRKRLGRRRAACGDPRHPCTADGIEE
jgi:hypothetical protein